MENRIGFAQEYRFLIRHCGLLMLFFEIACGRFPGTEFALPMDNITAVRGDDVTFTCNVKHLGRNMVAWVKTDPVKLISFQTKVFRNKHKYKVHKQNNEEKWILSIRNVLPTDAGGYMCQINTQPMMAQIAFLSLKVPPTIKRFESSQDMTVREGDNVTLNCAADGSPEPGLSWRRVDNDVITLVPNKGGSSVVKGSQLNIQKVSRKHMAEYYCVAMNGIEPDDVYSVKLHVKFPPTVMPFVNQFVTAPVGGSAELKCRVESWPRPDSVQWSFKGALVTAVPNKIPTQKISEQCEHMQSSSACPISVGTLRIKNIRPEDFGSYTCEADNEEGVRSTTVVLQEDENSRNTRYNIVPQDDFGSGFSDDEDGGDVEMNFVRENELGLDYGSAEMPGLNDAGIISANNAILSQTGDASLSPVPNTERNFNKGAHSLPDRTSTWIALITIIMISWWQKL